MPGITRRTFAASSVAAAMAAPPSAQIEDITTISVQPANYHAWATLARRQNGELLVAYSGGREGHICPFGRVELIRSTDSGSTWTFPQIILDTAIDDRDAGICETAKGTLLATTFTSLAYLDTMTKSAATWPAEKRARWESANRRGTPQQFRDLLGTWMLRSTDNGLTWSAPYRVPLNSPHGPSLVSNGRLLYAGKKLWDTGTKIGMCESVDDGLTWRWLSDIPARPGDDVAACHELHQVEAADGRIIVHIRNHNPNNDRETLQCESADGGKTWTTPHSIGVWGLPSHLLRLSSGALLMSYSYRRAPNGNHVRISRDNARTWSEPIVFPADRPGSDLGYPATVELPNNRLVTVWYEQLKTAPQAVLRMARWKLEA